MLTSTGFQYGTKLLSSTKREEERKMKLEFRCGLVFFIQHTIYKVMTFFFFFVGR